MGYLSPGVGPFSPGLPYNGPSGYSFNPYMNAAPGAPIQNSGPIGSAISAPPLSMSQAFGGPPPKPEYFPVVDRYSQSAENGHDSKGNGDSNSDRDSGDDDVDAIQDTLKSLRIPEGLAMPVASSNRASFDGSKSAALLANFINDQRRASMDDTKPKAGFQHESPP